MGQWNHGPTLGDFGLHRPVQIGRERDEAPGPGDTRQGMDLTTGIYPATPDYVGALEVRNPEERISRPAESDKEP